jgi:cation transport ATPase
LHIRSVTIVFIIFYFLKSKVTALFKLSKNFRNSQDATARKSQTQVFIAKFAKIYTPIVMYFAIAITIITIFLSMIIFSVLVSL